MANPNWRRWIHTSIGTYLKQVATDNQYAALIEGIDDRSAAFQEASDRVEIRVNGPFSNEISSGYHKLQIFVNVLVTSHMGGAKKNATTMDTILGKFHSAMDGSIAISRLGTGGENDGTLLGCMTPKPGKNDSIKVFDFGQIDKTDRIRQGAVDAAYIMYLTE